MREELTTADSNGAADGGGMAARSVAAARVITPGKSGTADQSPATRRAVLLSATAVGATAALAACGDDGGSASPPSESSEAATVTGNSPAASPTGGGHTGMKIAAAADIPVGGGVVFADHQVVVTQPNAGTFKGFSVSCTHKGCPVSQVEGGTINCTCHGSKFSIEDGSVTKGPATEPLSAKAVKNEGGSIVLG